MKNDIDVDIDAIEARANAATAHWRTDVPALIAALRSERNRTVQLESDINAMLTMANADTEYAKGFRTGLQEALRALGATA